jgi:hypothetical protein
VQPTPRPGVAIGNHILDLAEIAGAGLFAGPLLKDHARTVFTQARGDLGGACAWPVAVLS